MKTNINQINELHNVDLYLYFYEDFLEETRTIEECEFIIKECGLKPKSRVLDLACGHGRHSIYLSSKKYEVIGIDLNRGFIEMAQQTSINQNVFVDFKIDNMLNIGYQNEFNCIILLFNSFGFLDKKDGSVLLRKMKSAIKNDAKIFIDIKNRDSIVKELTTCQVTEKGKDLMIDRISFNPLDGTTTNNRIYMKDGKRHDTPFSMQLYNYSEFEELLSTNGLKISKLYGNWKGGEFNMDSRRMIAVIENKD